MIGFINHMNSHLKSENWYVFEEILMNIKKNVISKRTDHLIGTRTIN
jgi:hypothetical protein